MAVRGDDPEYLQRVMAEERAEAERAAYPLGEGREELDLLLGVVRDQGADVETRIKAADKLAPYRHAKVDQPAVVVRFDMAGFLAQLRDERAALMSGQTAALAGPVIDVE